VTGRGRRGNEPPDRVAALSPWRTQASRGARFSVPLEDQFYVRDDEVIVQEGVTQVPLDDLGVGQSSSKAARGPETRRVRVAGSTASSLATLPHIG